MALYRIPAVYVWNGSEWLLTLPTWYEDTFWYTQQLSYSANGTGWTTGSS